MSELRILDGKGEETRVVSPSNPLPVLIVGGGDGSSVSAADISDASDVGKSVLTADTAEAAREVLGAAPITIEGLPEGGSNGQVLKRDGEGLPVWATDDDTTYEAATTSTAGLVRQAPAVADATGEEDVADQLNALLAALRGAGVLNE